MHPTGNWRHGRCVQLQLWIAVLGVLLLQRIYLRLHLSGYEACYVSVQGEGRTELSTLEMAYDGADWLYIPEEKVSYISL